MVIFPLNFTLQRRVSSPTALIRMVIDAAVANAILATSKNETELETLYAASP